MKPPLIILCVDQHAAEWFAIRNDLLPHQVRIVTRPVEIQALKGPGEFVIAPYEAGADRDLEEYVTGLQRRGLRQVTVEQVWWRRPVA